MERFTAIEQYFRNSTKRLGQSELKQAARGLAFVQLYAVYEHAVKEVTRIAIKEIAGHAHRYSDLKLPILAIFLDPEMRSLRDCRDKDIWQRRLDLLKQATCGEEVKMVEVVPHDGSHFKHTQTELILRMLGVTRTLTVRRRHLYEIDEVVNNRNSISHGDETDVEIGRRYSSTDIHRKIRVMKSVCIRLVDIVAQHCSAPLDHIR